VEKYGFPRSKTNPQNNSFLKDIKNCKKRIKIIVKKNILGKSSLSNKF